MSRNEPASTRLVPADRLTAINSLLAEGAVFEIGRASCRERV